MKTVIIPKPQPKNTVPLSEVGYSKPLILLWLGSVHGMVVRTQQDGKPPVFRIHYHIGSLGPEYSTLEGLIGEYQNNPNFKIVTDLHIHDEDTK